MSKNSKPEACVKKTSIGGQALIEGIMMRGPKKTAMAVRNPQGEIVLEEWETRGASRSGFVKLPIIRGVVGFIDSMVFGYKCLMRSAEIAGLEELEAAEKAEKEKKRQKNAAEEAPAPAKAPTEEVTAKAEDIPTAAEPAPVAEAPATAEAEDAAADSLPEEKEEISEVTHSRIVRSNTPSGGKEKKKSSPLMNVLMVISTVLGVALAVVLFIMIPSFLYEGCAKLIPALKPQSPALTSLIKSVFEGVLKIAILVGYMALVSLMKDIRRTFQYHGAEHKTIFCYEHDCELTVENVRKQRRFHPRCGTSFLILMLLVGMFISFFIDPFFLAVTGHVPPTVIRVLIRLLLLPLVMGIGYELIKFAGRHDNLFTRIISAPGMWLQHITVLEPTDDMIECAITAFREVIPNDDSDRY